MVREENIERGGEGGSCTTRLCDLVEDEKKRGIIETDGRHRKKGGERALSNKKEVLPGFPREYNLRRKSETWLRFLGE